VVQIFYLTGPNEGKASRFLEDLAKTRVEGRFSEMERESQKWEARCANGLDLTVFSALFEQKEPVPEGRGPPARIRILVDPGKSGLSVKTPLDAVDVAASVSIVGDGFYRLEVVGPNDYSTKDHLTAVEFLPVLTKRIGNILQMRSQIRNPALVPTLLLRNQHILQSLRIITDYNMETVSHGRSSRPHSPVKILKNLFEGGVSKENTSFRKPLGSSASIDFPQLLPTPQSRPSSNDGPSKGVIGVSSAHDAIEGLTRHEETMLSYILAMHARKGNIVGKVLRARQSADELAVNDLYNSLLEDPSKHQLAAEVPVDVLFAAFEKFVKIAWHDKMGPIISRQAYKNIQLKMDAAGDFDDVFRAAICDMAPQNQRAFRDIVKLLVDLLHGTGNDGDRGMLTISFAELLVPEGNPHEFVSVLDRLVEDSDPLLSEQALSGQPTPRGSMTSESRSRATNTGSLTSNTSSLRKKFGFGTLTRKSSKIQSEGEPEINSVWRTLSKSKHSSDSQPASTSKAALGRSNSTDAGDYRVSPKRPVSRDRPTVLGAFGFDQQPSPFALSTIGENPVAGPPRKKRRSSVSDMRSLQTSAGNTPTFMSPKTPTGEGIDTSILKESPRTPSPVKQSMIPAPSPSTPKFSHSTIRGTSPARRENSPQRALPRPLNVTKQPASPQKSDQANITSKAHTSSRRRKDSTASGIPKLAPGLSERPSAGNVRKLPPTPGSPEKNPLVERPTGIPAPSSPQKLKMQSPTKLRERLANEQKTIQNADAALQVELSKIGDEITKLSKGRAGSPQPSQRSQNGLSTSSSAAGGDAVKALEGRLASLSKKHADMMGVLTSRLDNLASDIASSLQVSESRSRKLDDLYREANAENEALYAKFNEELVRVLGCVKGGQAEEEGRLRMKVMEEEAEKLRRENGRLRREVVGLRAQLKE